jgi:two-component system sensor histidine kinase HydH
VPVTSEYWPLKALPIPAVVVRADRVVYANPSMTALLGTSLEELSRLSMPELLERFTPQERTWVEPLHEARSRGMLPPGSDLWLRVRAAKGQERMCRVITRATSQPEEELVVVLDMELEDSMRRLTEALVAIAAKMMHCRDEEAVLELAVEAIYQQGFHVTVLRLEGKELVHGPMRQDPAAVALSEQLYGRPIREVRFASGSLPHVETVLAERKAAYTQDIHLTLEKFHAPELAAFLKRTFPNTRALDAPIFIGDEPYGILAVQGQALTPASAGTLELFAGMVGGALENVRHHHQTASRLAEVSRLQRDLMEQERLKVLGEAAGVVAHEVRNPLGAILNVATVLRRESKLSAIGASAVVMLEEEVTRLEDMVRDLLDVVRPFEVRARPVHLGDLALHAMHSLQPVATYAQAHIELEEAPGLPLLQGDETLLHLAVSNLLRYALRSSPSGGKVRLALERVEGDFLVVVEDQGAGLAAVDSQRVFEPFFTSRATGAGLGLTVVRRVALAHGGSVDVKDRPGGGARFELRLPGGFHG